VRLYRVEITVTTYVLAASRADAEDILDADHGAELMSEARHDAAVFATPATTVPEKWKRCLPWHAPDVEDSDLPEVRAEEWARHTAEREAVDKHNAEMAARQVGLPGVTP
jgi:hypothetical protein